VINISRITSFVVRTRIQQCAPEKKYKDIAALAIMLFLVAGWVRVSLEHAPASPPDARPADSFFRALVGALPFTIAR